MYHRNGGGCKTFVNMWLAWDIGMCAHCGGQGPSPSEWHTCATCYAAAPCAHCKGCWAAHAGLSLATGRQYVQRTARAAWPLRCRPRLSRRGRCPRSQRRPARWNGSPPAGKSSILASPERVSLRIATAARQLPRCWGASMSRWTTPALLLQRLSDSSRLCLAALTCRDTARAVLSEAWGVGRLETSIAVQYTKLVGGLGLGSIIVVCDSGGSGGFLWRAHPCVASHRSKKTGGAAANAQRLWNLQSSRGGEAMASRTMSRVASWASTLTSSSQWRAQERTAQVQARQQGIPQCLRADSAR